MELAQLQDVPSISPCSSIDLARISNEPDDDFVTFAEYLTNEPLFQSPHILPETSDVPFRDGFCSTSLPWERPQLGGRAGNPSYYAPLSPEEESWLRSIAMPALSRAVTPLFSPLPEPQEMRNPKKRKSSKSSGSDFCSPACRRHLGSQKRAHSAIERRYRANLNGKLATLRDSIPSIRIIGKDSPCGEDMQEGLHCLPPTHKLDKVGIHSHSLFSILASSSLSSSNASACQLTIFPWRTILSKATKYIVYLEKQTKSLSKENQALKARIDDLEILVMSLSRPESTAHMRPLAIRQAKDSVA